MSSGGAPHGFLFDLEGTLVDVSAIDAAREARRWSEYRAGFSETVLFAGITEVVDHLAGNGISWAVVTNVPSAYSGALLKHHGLKPALLIAYHDVKKAKPAPDMAVLACSRLQIDPENARGVGDTWKDARCFEQAAVPSYGAGWNPRCEHDAGWTIGVLNDPRRLLAP